MDNVRQYITDALHRYATDVTDASTLGSTLYYLVATGKAQREQVAAIMRATLGMEHDAADDLLRALLGIGKRNARRHTN